MECIALVGESGTGKSHRAQKVAFEQNIDLIIDDGLLIKGTSIVGGMSAKKQHTKLGAVKTAIFTEAHHRDEAIAVIKQLNPQRVLILGTSEEMTCLIASRLELPKPSRIISINEIASRDEISKAQYVRHSLGQHVIPAPTLEVEKKWPDFIAQPLNLFMSKGNKADQLVEQSVTQPTYTRHGNLTISPHAVEDIVRITLSFIRDIHDVVDVKVINEVMGMDLIIYLELEYDSQMRQIAQKAQRSIQNTFDFMTNLPIEKIDVIIKKLYLPENLRLRH